MKVGFSVYLIKYTVIILTMPGKLAYFGSAILQHSFKFASLNKNKHGKCPHKMDAQNN